jgi:glycopeptide antibiotics resistance protein
MDNAVDRHHPPLSYDLREKKRSIAITWFILILFTSILIEFFYFVLRYGAKTSTDLALTVPTAILGVFSILTIGFRTFKLLRKNSDCRPVDGKWWAVR